MSGAGPAPARLEPGARLVLLVAIAAAVLEGAFGSAMAPLLPSFQERYGLDRGGAGLLTAGFQVGVLAGALAAVALASRIGLRALLLVAVVLGSAGCLLIAVLDSAEGVTLGRVAQGLGGSLAWTASLAWVVTVTAPDRRGAMLGRVTGSTLIGVMIGPVLGAAAVGAGVGPVFGAAAALTLLGAVVVMRLPAAEPPPMQPLTAALRRALAVPGYRATVLVLTALTALLGAFEVLVPLRLDALGGSERAIAAVWIVAALFEAAASMRFGALSDRYGRWVFVTFGLLAVALVTLSLGLAGTLGLFVIAVLLFGPAEAAVIAPGTALASDGAEGAGVGQVQNFAIIGLIWCVGVFSGAVLSGFAATAWGDPAALIGAAAVCLVAAAGAASQLRRRPGASPEPAMRGGLDAQP